MTLTSADYPPYPKVDRNQLPPGPPGVARPGPHLALFARSDWSDAGRRYVRGPCDPVRQTRFGLSGQITPISSKKSLWPSTDMWDGAVPLIL